jgi:hypothetical protein
LNGGGVSGVMGISVFMFSDISPLFPLSDGSDTASKKIAAASPVNNKNINPSSAGMFVVFFLRFINYVCSFEKYCFCSQYNIFHSQMKLQNSKFVGLSNMLNRDAIEEGDGRKPREGSHRSVIRSVLMSSKLFSKIIKREEASARVEDFLIFTMTSFDFAVMSGSVRFD